MLRKQGVGQDARGDRPGLLPLSVVVLALGPLDDLVRPLVEVEACATRKERQRDRRGDRLDSPSACDRFHCKPASPTRDSRLKGCSALKAPRVKASARAHRPALPIEPAQIRASAPLKTKPQVASRASDRCSELPRFGMSTKPDNAARIRELSEIGRIEIRAPVAVLAGGNACNWLRVFISKRRGLRRMGSLIVPRRQFLRGLASLAVCAPAVVRASSLMGVSARFCDSSHATPPWAATQDALALLQHEMERRFAETLFGAESLPAEAEYAVPAWNPRRRGSQDHSVVGAANVVRASRFAAQTVRRSARRSAGRSCFDVWSLARCKL